MIAFGCAVTHQSGQPVLLSAERNSDHDIVGLAQRFPNGDKRVVKGSQRGLILPLDMPAKPRRMVVGEGLSDTLALHDAMEHDEDTLVCGRAAKGAGLEEVVRLARRHCVREAVLCLDSDDSHPEAGGMKLGRLLAEEGIATKLVRPPDDKDFRDWWRFPETTREDVQMLIDRTAPLPNKEPYRVYTGTDGLEDVPVPFLIPGLVTRGGLIGIVAPSNGGKTSLVTAMIAAITMKGSKFMGRNTEHGAVLWLVAEGRAAIGPRVHAAYSELGTEKQKARGLARLMRVYDQVPLHDQDAMQSFIATVNRTGQKPLVVVLDTWAALMEGDENDNADTKAALAGCRMMQREWDCALVILHHLRKDGAVERGSSVWKAALDVMIRVELDSPKRSANDRLMTLHVEKARDFASPPPTLLSLHATEHSVCVRVPKLIEGSKGLRDKRADPILRALRPDVQATLDDLCRSTRLRRRQVQERLRTLLAGGKVKRAMRGKIATFLLPRGQS